MGRKQRVTATVKMTYIDDMDLIAWWNNIPRGKRNVVMKQAMRAFINGQPIQPQQPTDQVSEDLAWLREALSELPSYVERVIHQVVVSTASMPSLQPEERVDNESARRREERMRRKQW